MKRVVVVLFLCLLLEPSLVGVANARSLPGNFQQKAASPMGEVFSKALEFATNPVTETHTTPNLLAFLDPLVSVYEMKTNTSISRGDPIVAMGSGAASEIITEVFSKVEMLNFTKLFSDLSGPESPRTIREVFLWALNAIPTAVSGKLRQEWQNDTKNTLWEGFLEVPEEGKTDTPSQFFWELIDEIQLLGVDSDVWDVMNEINQTTVTHQPSALDGVDKITGDVVWNLVQARSVSDAIASYRGISNLTQPINMTQLMEEVNEQSGKTLLSKLARTIVNLPHIGTLLRTSNFQNDLLGLASFLGSLVPSSMGDAGNDGTISMLELSTTGVVNRPMWQKLIMSPLLLGLVCVVLILALQFYFTLTFHGRVKLFDLYELRTPVYSRGGAILVGLATVAYVCSILQIGLVMIKAGLKAHRNMQQTPQRQAVRDSAKTILDILADVAHDRAVDRLEESPNKHMFSRDMEEGGDPEPAAEEKEGLLFQQQKFMELFEENMDDQRRVPVQVIVDWMVGQGVAPDVARKNVLAADKDSTRKISFEHFKEAILDSKSDSDLATLFLARYQELRSSVVTLQVALMVLATDGSTTAQYTMLSFLIFVVVVLCSAMTRLGVGTFQVSSQVRHRREIGVFKALAKVSLSVIGLLIFFLMTKFMTNGCGTITATCPNIASSATPEALCSTYRYYETGMNCHPTDVFCMNGYSYWKLNLDAGTPSDDFFQFLRSSFSLSQNMDDNQAITYVNKHGLFQVTDLCLTSYSAGESTFPDCKVVGGSGSILTLEDLGENIEDPNNDNLETLLAQKDIFFEDWKEASACQTVPEEIQTVRARPARFSEFEFYRPAKQGTQNVTMFTLLTPEANGGVSHWRMCERQEGGSGFSAASADCAYVFAPVSSCADQDCSASDLGPAMSGSVVDSLYYAVISHTTVGLGDIPPYTLRAKMTLFIEALTMTMISLF